jgi:hypothetical protein
MSDSKIGCYIRFTFNLVIGVLALLFVFSFLDWYVFDEKYHSFLKPIAIFFLAVLGLSVVLMPVFRNRL